MNIEIGVPLGAGFYFVPKGITCTRIADEGCTDEQDLIIVQLMKAGF